MGSHAVHVKDRLCILKDIIKNGKRFTTTVEELGIAEEVIVVHGYDNPKQCTLSLDIKICKEYDPGGRHYSLRESA